MSVATPDLAANVRRFLDGMAREAVIDRAVLDRAGTTVIGREDRAGSGALACYRAGAHLVVWGDPAVVERAMPLAGPATLTDEELAARLDGAGFERFATVRSNLLDGAPTPPAELAAEYAQQWLRDDEPGVVDRVRAFTERCDPDEVEAAALDELDEFAEAAINVVTPAADPAPGEAPEILAYASASDWDWDADLADIGVLVRADHRGRGLARFAVANTVARLLADGRVPFYRHAAENTGSAATAAGVGFRPVATLHYFVDRTD